MSESCDERELMKLRVDYAWKYFDFHAKQRTTVFNFFAVFSGIFFVALAQLLEDGQHFLLMVFSAGGIIITILFFFLERRNEELVFIGEKVLVNVENDILFKNSEPVDEENINRNPEPHFPQIRKELLEFLLNKENSATVNKENSATVNKENSATEKKQKQTGPISRQVVNHSEYTHGVWLPAIYRVIAFLYIISFMYGLIYLTDLFSFCKCIPK